MKTINDNKNICPDGIENLDVHMNEFWQRLTACSDIPLERLEEICNAEREGRLVVLSTPMVPIVMSEDAMNTDVYCPACGETLSGGWPNYHTDQEWKLCQCFHCGQSVDETKTITRAEAEAALKGADHDRD